MRVLFVLIFALNLLSKEFTVASYNVQNLFDLRFDGTEYKEFIPSSNGWNKKKYSKKLNSIARVINLADKDIVGLQEIESNLAMQDLMKLLPKYRYYRFLKSNKTSVGIAIISKYPIVDFKKVSVVSRALPYRPILKAVVKIDQKKFIVYVNHWTSKHSTESRRVIYAKAMIKEAKSQNSDYIIIGDFNSNYDEYQTLKLNKKLNDTGGKTGINHILRSNIKDELHFNPWLELDEYSRYSFNFRGFKQTPDHILISKFLFDDKGISYVKNSFSTFKDKGSSDHMMIYAKFTTDKTVPKKRVLVSSRGIAQLYSIDSLLDPARVQDAIVIYKYKKSAIIKDSSRAILLYNCAKDLKVGHKYDLTIDRIDKYFSLKEVIKISNIVDKGYYREYKSLFLDGSRVDVTLHKYQNEIVTNLDGVYRSRHLYLSSGKKIRLYFKDKRLIPKEKTNLSIVRGVLSAYRSTPQIVLHRKGDYIVKP
jgi:endonuclease/exonuclease/phosphatase family metal-dependent hydrolase